MNPPVVGINTERFTALWETFQTEANKLASGMECSGMEIYTSIYQIVSGGDVSYAVRLHWCIGKFFFALAVKLREKIHGEDWIEDYAEAFCQYETTVETIDLLALHLNEAILENKECKNIKDLGYVIWERCILRQRYERKLPSLSESLPKKREHAEVCLRSLSKIATNSEDRFEYYKNNYETALLSSIISEFKQDIETQQEDLPGYLAQCSLCISSYMETYAPLFLPISLSVLEDSLEKVLFPKQPDVLKEEVQKILYRKDKNEIQILCSAIRVLKKKIFPMFLVYLSEFCLSVWPADKSCAAASAAYSELADMLTSESCDKTLGVLQKTLSIKITRPGIGKELSVYLEALIHRKDYAEIKMAKVLLDCIMIKEEKEIFYTLYIAKLSERLFSLRFDPSIEKSTSDSLNFPWVVKKKVQRIFNDMVLSTKENELFKQKYGFGHYRYKTSYGDDIFFYGIIATAYVWPISEDAVQNINLPEDIKGITQVFSEQYLAKHPRRKITWVDTLSTVEIEIETDRMYCIEMPLTHYAVLKMLEQEPGTLDKITLAVRLSTKSATNIIESLQKAAIILCVDDVYFLNDNFANAEQKIKLKASEGAAKRIGNRKSYYQAWVSRKLKQEGECALNDLSENIQKTHTEIFEWNVQEYTEALKNLNERGLIEIVGPQIKYVP
ncbi:hypothetical protein NEMIN01_0126 [Nematocida minor]|uniref:uncharacterized protein n=1 Tax=Nematocida minor TaxID=1912983 RepID=UPI00221FAC58|nr:uncharacterized protein NEMIN01_0022 [Nematocida minor]XP_051332028.1 uncharacterized protein NEMIN01_0126 [Nematocida minor]KAI5188758.1 hypothetical protein NEMIN01_0022 [Nematocida minor]KAI5188862.1 hypothetical protein NEMIN01_0126 [Nematocida minor]